MIKINQINRIFYKTLRVWTRINYKLTHKRFYSHDICQQAISIELHAGTRYFSNIEKMI